MSSKHLTERILEHAHRQPEGTPLSAKGLLHLGNRAAADQALSAEIPNDIHMISRQRQCDTFRVWLGRLEGGSTVLQMISAPRKKQ